MPDPSTTRLALYKSKSDGSELVNYTQDLGQNWDKVDAAVGFASCTSSTRPSSPYSGKPIMETDTSYRTYFSNGTAPASASWVEIPNGSAAFNSTLRLASGKQINVNSSGSGATLAVVNAATTTDLISSRVSGDTQDRFLIDTDGTLNWGPGNATPDVNLYRSAANTLRTADNLVVDLALTVTGNATITGTASAQVETTTSGATAGTNFSVTSFAGRRTCGVATVVVTLSYSGSTITADSAGNITDTLAVTLPSGWRPNATIIAAFDKSGTATGDVVILNDGTCTLKTLSPTATIASGATVTFSATYVL